MGMRSSQEPLRITSIDDAIHLLPHLLGFQPEESLVTLIVGPPGCSAEGLVARMDLLPLSTRAGFLAGPGAIETAYPSCDMLMVVFSQDVHQGLTILRNGLPLLTRSRVLEAVVTDQVMWQGISCADDCPGHRVANGSRVHAEAVYRGLAVLPNRSSLAEAVGPAHPSQLRIEHPLRVAVQQQVAHLSSDEQTALAQKVRDGVVATGAAPSAEQAWQLVICLENDEVARHLWETTPRDGARKHAELWSQVLTHCPDDHTLAVLALHGLACWLCGDGALESVSLERARLIHRADPSSQPAGTSLIAALETTYRALLAPHTWDVMPRDPAVMALGEGTDESLSVAAPRPCA